jgi:hypothetical protein
MKANPLGLLAILSITRLTESTRKSFKKPNIYQQTGTNQFNEGQHVNICDSHRLQVDRSSGKPFVDSLQWCEKRDLYEIGNELQHAQNTPPPHQGRRHEVGEKPQPIKKGINVNWSLENFNSLPWIKPFLSSLVQ